MILQTMDHMISLGLHLLHEMTICGCMQHLPVLLQYKSIKGKLDMQMQSSMAYITTKANQKTI